MTSSAATAIDGWGDCALGCAVVPRAVNMVPTLKGDEVPTSSLRRAIGDDTSTNLKSSTVSPVDGLNTRSDCGNMRVIAVCARVDDGLRVVTPSLPLLSLLSQFAVPLSALLSEHESVGEVTPGGA